MHTWNRCYKITRAVSEAKFICIDIAGKDWILCSITTWYTNAFRWKDLKKALHFIHLLPGWKLAWQKNSSSNPTTWCARDTLKCGLGKKEVQTPDVVLLSESQVYTLIRGVYIQMICAAISGDLPLRDACLGKPSMCKRSFTSSNVDSRRKGSSGKGMKGGKKEAHKTTTMKVHFVALMDIR